MAEPIKTEQWKTIKDFPDYAVSDFGRLKRITAHPSTKIGRIRKPVKTKIGYLQVVFSNPTKAKLIHRLVLETFTGICPKDKECNHKDGNKANNNFSNLEWVTSSKNRKHAYKFGLNPIREGEKAPFKKLSKVKVIEIRKLYKTGQYSQRQLAEQFVISKGAIKHILRRRTWKHI